MLRQAAYMIELQILWIIVVVFKYDNELLENWQCQLLAFSNLFLIFINLFYLIPSCIKSHVIVANIQMLKDPAVVEETIFASRKEITLAFGRFYRLLKRFDFGNRDHMTKYRDFIMSKIDEIFIEKLEYNMDDIYKLIYMVGVELDSNELKHFISACSR